MRRFGITVACTLNARGPQKQGSDGRPCSHNDVRRYMQVPYVNLCLASKYTALSDPAQTSSRFQARPCGFEEPSKVTNCIQVWNCTLCTPSSLLLVGFHMLHHHPSATDTPSGVRHSTSARRDRDRHNDTDPMSI